MIYFYVSLITYLAFIVLKFCKGLKQLNENKFNLKKYNKWVMNKSNFWTVELFGLVLIIVAFNANAKVTEICTLVLYGLLFVMMFKNFKFKIELDKKNKLVILLGVLIYALVLTLIGINGLKFEYDFNIYENYKYYYLVIVLMGYFIYYIIYVLGFITNLIYNDKKKKKA